MKRKLAELMNSKGGKWTVIGTTAFLLLGVAAFVVGYGIADGWDAVLAWFSSKWAITVYIAAGLWVIVVLYIIVLSKRGGIGDE